MSPSLRFRRAQGAAFTAIGLALTAVLAWSRGNVDAALPARPQTGVTQADVVIRTPAPVSGTRPPFGLVESYAAINPAAPANIIASAMSTTATASVIYVSTDTGQTWELAENRSGTTFPGGDPMVVFGANGAAYFVTIAPSLAVWRSDDLGRFWHGPTYIGDSARFDDRGWVAVTSDAARPPRLYAAAKTRDLAATAPRDVLIVATSHDSGMTFEGFNTIRDTGFLQAPTHLLARPDGTFLLAELTNYARMPDGRYRGEISIRTIATDGAISARHPVAEYVSFGDAHGNRRWMGLGVTLMAEDRSNPARTGPVYMVWSAPSGAGSRAGDALQIQLAQSTDGGKVWASPIRVNQGGFAANHSSPAVAVNKHGVVAVSWMDRRDDATQACFRPYIALSTDGGRSFQVERRVSTEPTCPGDGSRWMNGGETHGLVALSDGSFRMIWTGGTATDLRLWSTVISVGKNGTQPGVERVLNSIGAARARQEATLARGCACSCSMAGLHPSLRQI